MAKSGLTVRVAGLHEVSLILDWAAAEGWNPGHADAQRDELEVSRAATEIVAVRSRRGESRDEYGVEPFHDGRHDTHFRRNREMDR